MLSVYAANGVSTLDFLNDPRLSKHAKAIGRALAGKKAPKWAQEAADDIRTWLQSMKKPEIQTMKDIK